MNSSEGWGVSSQKAAPNTMLFLDLPEQISKSTNKRKKWIWAHFYNVLYRADCTRSLTGISHPIDCPPIASYDGRPLWVPHSLGANKPTQEGEPVHPFSASQLSNGYWPKIFLFQHAYKLKTRNETIQWCLKCALLVFLLLNRVQSVRLKVQQKIYFNHPATIF